MRDGTSFPPSTITERILLLCFPFLRTPAVTGSFPRDGSGIPYMSRAGTPPNLVFFWDEGIIYNEIKQS